MGEKEELTQKKTDIGKKKEDARAKRKNRHTCALIFRKREGSAELKKREGHIASLRHKAGKWEEKEFWFKKKLKMVNEGVGVPKQESKSGLSYVKRQDSSQKEGKGSERRVKIGLRNKKNNPDQMGFWEGWSKWCIIPPEGSYKGIRVSRSRFSREANLGKRKRNLR